MKHIHFHFHDHTAIEIRKAAGVLIIAKGQVLLLQRNGEDNYPFHWGLPAGGIEVGETPMAAAMREAYEEIGLIANKNSLREIAHTTTDVSDFTTFLLPLREQFTPTLNFEHLQYKWADPDDLPSPMIPTLRLLLGRIRYG
jgi:8-oxo-dGTP pyrophosphatase MutT (NUDIX family)